MDSDYCYGVELRKALERHERKEAKVIPIILRRVHWQDVLGNLQALPTDAKPVKGWQDEDEAFFDVVKGIRTTVEELTTKSKTSASPVLMQMLNAEQHTSSVGDVEVLTKGLDTKRIKRGISQQAMVMVLVVLALAIVASSFIWLLHPQQSSLQSNPNTLTPETAHTRSSTVKTLVDVQANSDWQNSGVSVQQGKAVKIEYISGYWRPWPGVNFDGTGCQSCNPQSDPNNIYVPCHHGSLIARIGSSEVFCIGNGATVTATDGGMVYLRINDKVISDDSGAITVRITLV